MLTAPKQNQVPTSAPEEKSLREVLKETSRAIRERRESTEILGLRRKAFSPGGGEYLVEEVIGYRPK